MSSARAFSFLLLVAPNLLVHCSTAAVVSPTAAITSTKNQPRTASSSVVAGFVSPHLPPSSAAAVPPSPPAGSKLKNNLPRIISAPRGTASRTVAAGIMASLPPRGGGRGGGGPRNAKDESQRDDEDEDKKAREAVSSMRYTYRMCFAAVIADVFITAIDDSVWNEPLTWLTAVDLFDSLNLVMFGLGLRRVTKLYGAALKSKLDMTAESVYDLCNTMARIWRTTAFSLVGVATTVAVTFRRNAAGLSAAAAGAVPPDATALSSAAPTFPVGVVAAAILGSVVVRRWCANDAAEAVRTEEEKAKPLKPDAQRARTAGFRTCRNMALCAGAFALMAAVQLATWIVSPTGLVGRVFSVTDFITPFTIAGLLVALYKNFRRAIMTVTRDGSSESAKTIDFSVYDDLYEAQKGFYSNVGDTLKSATIFSLLPYLFAPIQPYVMPYLISAAKFVAPSLAGDL